MGARLREYTFNDMSLANDVFIETGTHKGGTLACASVQGFKDLYSIEVKEANYLICCERFEDQDNIHLFHGSSPNILPQVIDPVRATTFWLDAHFQGGPKDELDVAYGECPLLAELKVIFGTQWTVNPYVLIDDAHCFTGRLHTIFDFKQWPTLNNIRDLLPANYSAGIHNDIIYCMPNCEHE